METTSKGEIVIYQTPDGNTNVNVRLENDTVWLTQDQLAVLFERDKSVISRHINNIFSEGKKGSELTQILYIFFYSVSSDDAKIILPERSSLLIFGKLFPFTRALSRMVL